MLLLKKIDVYGQIFIMTVGSLIALGFWGKQSILIYFIVGAWQIVSTILHLLFGQKLSVAAHRKQYQIILAIICFVVALAFISEIVLVIALLILLLFSPFLAVWYCRMSYKELNRWQARALIHFR